MNRKFVIKDQTSFNFQIKAIASVPKQSASYETSLPGSRRAQLAPGGRVELPELPLHLGDTLRELPDLRGAQLVTTYLSVSLSKHVCTLS